MNELSKDAETRAMLWLLAKFNHDAEGMKKMDLLCMHYAGMSAMDVLMAMGEERVLSQFRRMKTEILGVDPNDQAHQGLNAFETFLGGSSKPVEANQGPSKTLAELLTQKIDV